MQLQAVKTVNPVAIYTNERQPISCNLYFVVLNWNHDLIMRSSTDHEVRGTVTFVVKTCQMVNGKLVEIKGVSPIIGEYKQTTFRNLFGAITLNDFYDLIPDLTIQEIVYKAQQESGSFWGLTSPTMLEIVQVEIQVP